MPIDHQRCGDPTYLLEIANIYRAGQWATGDTGMLAAFLGAMDELAEVGSVLEYHRRRAAEANRYLDELTNDVLQHAPETFDDDVAAEVIAVRYVRHLEETVERLLAQLGRPRVHLVKVDLDGWTMQHPPTCPDLFDCDHTAMAQEWEGPPEMPGMWVMDDGGHLTPWAPKTEGGGVAGD